jgi:hypothetical protein
MWLAAVLIGVESWLMPVSTGVSIFKVTTPLLSHRAIARCAGKSSGIGAGRNVKRHPGVWRQLARQWAAANSAVEGEHLLVHLRA